MEIDEKEIIHALNENILESKRLKELKLDTRNVEMLESKNENNLSYLQSLKYINEYNGQKTIIIGFENVSRRYKYNDLSWLYDVDFEVLDTDDIDKIFCIGRFKYDVAQRLINAGINKDKLILVDNIKNIVRLLRQNSNGTIFTIACFDMTAILKKLIVEANNEN